MQKETIRGFRVSPQQKQLWSLLGNERSLFHRAQCTVLIEGPLDRRTLEAALQQAVSRHEILRTTFHSSPETRIPLQVIGDDAAVSIKEHDLSELNPQEQEARIEALLKDAGSSALNPAVGSPLQLSLAYLSTSRHVLVITLPALCADAVALDVLVREISRAYAARAKHEVLADEPLQYADISEWLNELLNAEDTKAGREYWSKHDLTYLHGRSLAYENEAPDDAEFEPDSISITITPETGREVSAAARKFKTTAAVFMLACWQALLWRLSRRPEVIVGCAYDNRKYRQLEESLGLLAKYLPIQAHPRQGQRFSEFLSEVNERTADAYAWQEYFSWEQLERTNGNAPTQHFFPLCFEYEQQAGTHRAGEVTFAVERRYVCLDRFKLKLCCIERGASLLLELRYDSARFLEPDVRRLIAEFHTLLRSALHDPEASLDALKIVSPEERRQVLVQFNDTKVEYPLEKCLHEWFEQQAERTPENTAVVFAGETLTYRELNRRANQLAHYLRALKVGPETLAAVCAERSLEMIIGLLGILKAGGAYVPLDPTYPQERLSFMLEDAQATVLLTQQRLVANLPPHGAQIISLDSDWPDIAASASTENPSVEVNVQNPAYVIYTSGSTGTPKGAMNTHLGICNRLLWMQLAYPLNSTDAVLQKTTISFDVSVWEFFWPLIVGARLVLAEPGGHRDSAYLVKLISEQQITTLHFVPSMLKVFLEEEGLEQLRSLRRVISSGEALERAELRRFRERLSGCELHNLYGPTEAAVDVTAWACEGAESEEDEGVPIGRPIANTQIYILDEEMEVVPIGVEGELYIGGIGLARGYLKQAERTAERFVPNPFGEEAGGRLYRSGDLARHLRGGDIEYLGRLDNQVKIRGFRVEPGEIEAALRSHLSVAEAVVVLRRDSASEKRLVAYVVAAADAALDLQQLRQHLSEKLPQYMMPAAFVPLAALPLTPNGKIDRRMLPEPEQVRGVLQFVEAGTAIERELAGIWAEVLGVERVGMDDSFFELGGHSLLATQLISRVREVFGVEVALGRLFDEPTVRGLAASVEEELRGGKLRATPLMERVSREDELPLSFAQQRLWFLDQLEPDSSTYSMAFALRLSGGLDVDALEQSFGEIVRRHEVLRTSFATVDGQPVQIISAEASLHLGVQELSRLPEEERESVARRLAVEEAGQPFDLSTGPLLRVSLLRLAEEEHVLLVTMHHIVSDGWSMGVLVRELAALYTAFSASEPSPLPELQIQYADYAHWQREWLQAEVLEEQLRYWREQLAGAPALLELPTDRPRPAVQTFRGSQQTRSFSQSLKEKLQVLSRREGVTLFMTLLAAFQALLSRYSAQDDILIGTPIAGRNRTEVEPLIGFFVNTLVLRTKVSAEQSFRELLRRVREMALGAYTHQDVPFEMLVEELQPARSLSYLPLFQVMFVLQNAARAEVDLPGLKMQALAAEAETAKFDLTLSVMETAGELVVSIEHNTDLFDGESIRRMLHHFEHLLSAAVAEPQQSVSTLALLSPVERSQLLYEWNQTEAEYPRHLCIHQLFEAQVAETPEAIAVSDAEQSLSYLELNRRANRLAHFLRRVGVGPEQCVGILIERSVRMVECMLGVLKAGGAYLPLDSKYPAQRLAFMMKDAGARVVLTAGGMVEGVDSEDALVVKLDGEREEIDKESAENLTSSVKPDNLAYVIYTSGSTGRPKGVAITHHSAVTLIHWAKSAFEAEDMAGVMASTSICFDLSVFEIFVPLSWGGKVIVAENALQLPQLQHAGPITLINTVPSAMTELAGAGAIPASVRVVNLAGEPLKHTLVQQVYGYEYVRQVWNLYGPSEDTTYSTAALLQRDASEPPTIGRPVANTQVYLLDELLQPVPAGIPGELYIGGDGLARGYLDRPELTAEKFIPNPFSAHAGARMYDTGDLARYLSDGRIEFLGRSDHQVKVRGYRIEVGEIEAMLYEHESVREAVVAVREDIPGDKRLVAYVVGAEGQTLSVSMLRAHLSVRVPDYMIPSAFVELEQLPLTPNGKVDRRALPEPTRAAGTEHVEARTPVEEVTAGVWQEVLGRERVSVEENFFELGGHSLLATRVLSRVREVFGVEVALRRLFEEPTVKGLAQSVEAELRAGTGVSAVPLKAVSREEELVLSYGQQRLWFLDQLEPGSTAYNMPAAVRLTGELNVGALAEALTKIIRRHEVLRTTFRVKDGRPVQVIAEAEELRLEAIDVSGMSEEEREAEARRMAMEEAGQPFDLSAGPLLRVSLLRLGEDEHVLIVTMHHIVSDGWSMGVLVRELAALYTAFSASEPSPLPELQIQYADYAHWQREWLQGEVLDEQLRYWREQLADVPRLLSLPTDRPRPAVQTDHGGAHPFRLSASLTAELRALSRREGVTMFMTLLAAFKVLLSRYSEQEEIVVGTAIANRTRAEIEPLIGFFINTLALRTSLRGEPSFRELLGRVRETALGAYMHQEVPFEMLVEELEPERSLSYSPLFQVMFVLQNAPLERVQVPGLQISPVDNEHTTTKFDLTLFMEEESEHLAAVVRYNTDLFNAQTIARMMSQFEVLLEDAAAHPDKDARTLALARAEETRQLIYAFNEILE
jgi:amino acid adenylation domain-containing protein